VLPFDWDTAERVELKGQLIQQGDLVFLNIPFKGYDKNKDVRFAFSQDEVLLEVRDKSTKANKIHRLCNTLFKSIDLKSSDIQLFVDFICIKLVKVEKSEQWDSFGYEISNFTVPTSAEFKSNFIQPPKAKEEKKVEKPKEIHYTPI